MNIASLFTGLGEFTHNKKLFIFVAMPLPKEALERSIETMVHLDYYVMTRSLTTTAMVNTCIMNPLANIITIGACDHAYLTTFLVGLY